MCIGLMLGPPYFSTALIAQRWGDPILEVETIRDAEDLRLTLGDAPSQDRETMRIKTYIDFAFVVSYAAFFVALGTLLARNGGWWRAAGVLAAITGLAAGVFDVLENLAILDILDVRIAAVTPELLEAVRRPSAIKWSLVAVSAVTLLLSLIFKRQSNRL
jgi:hypothetical protein